MDILAGFGIIGIIIFIFLVVIAILWLVLPFAVFGIKEKLDINTDQLEKVTLQMGLIVSRLEKICMLIDPDGTKMDLHSQIVAQKESEVEAEELRKEREKELWAQEEQRQKEEQKKDERIKKQMQEQRRNEEKKREREFQILAKSQAEVNCPKCNKAITIKDLRVGSEHRCPYCTHVFVINAG